jgi:hypothetical protein
LTLHGSRRHGRHKQRTDSTVPGCLPVPLLYLCYPRHIQRSGSLPLTIRGIAKRVVELSAQRCGQPLRTSHNSQNDRLLGSTFRMMANQTSLRLLCLDLFIHTDGQYIQDHSGATVSERASGTPSRQLGTLYHDRLNPVVWPPVTPSLYIKAHSMSTNFHSTRRGIIQTCAQDPSTTYEQ